MCHDHWIARFDFHVDVARPAHVVFDYMIEPGNLREWDPRIVEVEHTPPGPLIIGTRIRETRDVLRRRVTQQLEVTEIEEPVLLALRIVEGPLPMQLRTVLEPQGATTRVHVAATSEAGGAARVAAPALVHATKRQLRGYYELLKQRLEGVAT